MRFRRFGLIALIVPIGAMTGVVAAASADASSGAAFVTSVSITGSISAPTVTVTGSGFGAKPINGVGVSGLPSCSGFSGTDYPNGELWLNDPNVPFSAGYYSGPASSNCVGINITSWTHHQVVYTFGSGYGTNGWLFADGNAVVVSTKGAPGSTIVSGL